MNPKAHSFILDGNAVEVFEVIIVVCEGENSAVIIIGECSRCRITAFSSPFSIKFVVFKRDNLRGGRGKSEDLIVSQSSQSSSQVSGTVQPFASKTVLL